MLHHRPIVSLSILLLLAAAPATGSEPAARPGTRPMTALDRDGDGRTGESWAIRNRYRVEALMRGLEGDPAEARELLHRAKVAYGRYLERGPELRAAGIGGGSWISLGPNNGAGRFTSISPHPTIAGTLLAGAAGGGVWRTRDSGITWEPLTDGIPNLSVGAVAYAPSDPNVVYLGTGEGGYAIDFIPGIGLLRSEDGGETWILPDEVVATQFYDLDVDPRDPDTLLAATNAGLLYSDTGGATWTTVVPGVVTGVVRSPELPDTLWAAVWCQGDTCPEGTDRVMRSQDGGLSWAPAARGLPAPLDSWALNRMAIAVAPSRSTTLVVAFNDEPADPDDDPPVRIFTTSTGGNNWTQVTKSPPPYLGGQGWYDNTITFSPDDPNHIVTGGVYYALTTDRGSSWIAMNPYAGGQNLPHVDAHDFAWQNGTLWVACDGGIWKSNDGGSTWIDCNSGLITRQYYSVAVDPANREIVLAGAQDNGTNMRRETGDNSWDHVIGGDGFECAINPLIPGFRYGSIYSTIVYRALPGEAFRDISPPYDPSTENAPFITPITLHPATPWVVFTGTSIVWRSPDAGNSWAALPTDVPGDEWNSSSIWSIAATAADPDVLMVAKGRDLYRSTDGGRTWTVTHFGEGDLPSRRILNVEISPFDADTALACLASLSGDSLWRTTDGGATWHQATTGLADFSVQVARWDPTDPSVVYAGTDVGLYRSTDGGLSWARFGDGLPNASIHEIRATSDGSMLRVATHGRGVWELDLDLPENTRPVAAVSAIGDPVEATVGDAVTFTGTATDADGDAMTAYWIFTDSWETAAGGSGTGSLESSTLHAFEMGGDFYAAFRVRDAKGGLDVATLPVVVTDPADECSTPRVIPGDGPFPLTIRSSNGNARMQDSDPVPPCIPEGDAWSGKWGSLWFEFTPETTDTWTFSTCGADADTAVTVWTGTACGEYAPVAGGCSYRDEAQCGGRGSNVEVELQAGTTYRIMVSSYDKSSRGRFNLTMTCAGCEPERRGVVRRPTFRGVPEHNAYPSARREQPIE